MGFIEPMGKLLFEHLKISRNVLNKPPQSDSD